jgi:O-antigen/teichoic acid export membrane protein
MLKNRKDFRFKFSFENSKYLIKSSIPLYGYTLFLVLFLQADVLLLKILSSEYAAGIYSAANRITMPLSIVPQAVVTTLFPIIVKNIESNKSNIIIESLTKKILLIAAVIPSIIVTFKSTEIVTLLFGNSFSEADFPLSILFWSYVFMFYNYFCVELQTALNKQHNNFFFGIIISSAMIILIYALAQKYEYDGVAVAKLCAAAFGTIYFLIFNRIYINLIFPFILWLISGFLVSYLISDVNLFLFILIIIMAYFVLAILIKIISKDELKILQDSVGKYKLLEKFAR